MRGARPLDDSEVNKLLQRGFTGRYKRRNRTLFAIGVSCGFRCSELLALTWRDVVHRRQSKDWITLKKRHTKGKTQSRTLKLQRFARKSVNEWSFQYRKRLNIEGVHFLDAPVFVSREGNPFSGDPKAIGLSAASKMLRAAFDRCGITGNVSTHSMRKTFANKVYQDAVSKFQAGQTMKEPIFVTKDLLGHKHIKDTLKYLSFLGSEVDEEVFNYDY